MSAASEHPEIAYAARRDQAIEKVLPAVAEFGWTMKALGSVRLKDADLLFPGGPADMVDAYIDFADRRMVEAVAPALPELRPSKRVRALILERLRQAQTHKAAVRRAASVLALPQNAAIAARTAARTADRIWHAAGDNSADFSWYTKRGILAAVYGATLLYWLHGDREEADVEAFLDRRLAGVARLGKLRASLRMPWTPREKPAT